MLPESGAGSLHRRRAAANSWVRAPAPRHFTGLLGEPACGLVPVTAALSLGAALARSAPTRGGSVAGDAPVRAAELGIPHWRGGRPGR